MARRTCLWPVFVTLILATGLASCDGGLTGVADSEELTPVRVTAFAVGTPISTLVVEVTAADINRRLVYNVEVVNGIATGTIDVPAGEARTFTVTAFDDQHNVTHEGSATTDVSPGSNPRLRIKLKPVSGQVEVEVTFGEYSVLVTPAEATIDATVSDQLQLTVEVLGPDDEPVQDPQVQWATTHPSMATVTASGLVTGIANGAVTVVATFDGVAGLSELTLTGFAPPTDFSGTWTHDLVTYTCAQGLVSVSFSNLEVVHTGQDISLTSVGSAQPGTMVGAAPVDGAFTATRTIPGDVTETYEITGSFDDANTMTAIFTIEFTGANLLDCTDQTFNLTATRVITADEYEPNDTFFDAYDLGVTTHDEPGYSRLANFHDPSTDQHDWYRIGAIDPGGSELSFSVVIEVRPPAGNDYDLYIHDDTDDTTPLYESVTRGDGLENVVICWGHPLELDLSRWFRIEVRHFSGPATSDTYELYISELVLWADAYCTVTP
jgi:hypothetical protein